MAQQGQKHITLFRISRISVLVLVLGGLAAYWAFSPDIPPQLVVLPAAEIKPEPEPAPRLTKLKPIVRTNPAAPDTPVAKPAQTSNEFVIQGLLSTGGEPWAANMILVKILWLKNRDNKQFLLGRETGKVQATARGFAYRIRLKPQTSEFLNSNAGVEGNVGRVVAFVDHKRDGRLSLKKDKIIAVSKELLRYRTGRYDKHILNDIQQQNIRQAGKGYVIVRNVPIGENKLDWQVVAKESPARLDLSATETSLPNMYNTFMKMQ